MMKKLHFLFVALFVTTGAIAQSCLPDGIIFETQGQIDSFMVNYPNCTEIEGNVTIYTSEETNITNLNGLSILNSIGGNLDIVQNNGPWGGSFLTTLTGLEGLTEIEGDLFIRLNSALTSLEGLNNLISVGGALSISSNNVLSSLSALGSLKSIGKDLKIEGNFPLTTLTGLEGVDSIGGELWVVSNYHLANLTGLDNLSYLGGGIYISDNTFLASITGSNHLTSIGGDITIRNNFQLTNIAGFDNLISIDGFLCFFNNTHLIEIAAFNNLTSIADYLRFVQNYYLGSLANFINLTSIGDNLNLTNNTRLTSLAGLDNIDAGSILSLYIRNNDSLSTCAILSICNYLVSPNGVVVIQDNNIGCNDPMQIQDSCVANAVTIGEFNLQQNLSIYPNPTQSTISIELPNTSSISTLLTLSKINGQEVFTSPIMESKTEIDISHLPAGIYIVKVCNDKNVMVQKLIKE